MVVEPMSNPIRKTVGVPSTPDATGCAADLAAATDSGLRTLETGAGTDTSASACAGPLRADDDVGWTLTVSSRHACLNGVEIPALPHCPSSHLLAS